VIGSKDFPMYRAFCRPQRAAQEYPINLEAIGLMQSQVEEKIGPILASTTCQFRKPLFYPGQVTVHSTGDDIRNTSFRIRYVICNEGHETAAEAQDIIVLYDFQKQCKLEIPKDPRDRIEKLENAGRKYAAQAGQ
jgi:acyl-CoA thioester hydrolase